MTSEQPNPRLQRTALRAAAEPPVGKRPLDDEER